MTTRDEKFEAILSAVYKLGSLANNQYDKPIFVMKTKNQNTRTYLLGSAAFRKRLQLIAAEHSITLTPKDLVALIDQLAGIASANPKPFVTHIRNAHNEQGNLEIEIGDKDHTCIQFVGKSYEVTKTNSRVHFVRPEGFSDLPLPLKSGEGNIKKLKKLVNLKKIPFLLLIAWITYTLAHPKSDSTNYPILVLQGDQGTGKSFLSRLVLRFTDPKKRGVEIFPSSVRDFAISANTALVLAFDNLRYLKPEKSDLLCSAATGGYQSTRALYTDSDTVDHWLLVALVINGIHAIISQPDLAQRVCMLQLTRFDEDKRLSEKALQKALDKHAPDIFGGLLDIIAGCLANIEKAEVTHPQRMFDFVQWIAALELHLGITQGKLQKAYGDSLAQSIRNSLEEHSLAACILRFAEEVVENKLGYPWEGTPSELLNALVRDYGDEFGGASDWPRNAIQLSKRLMTMQTAFASQGIDIRLKRGKQRQIVIATKPQRNGGESDE